MPFNLSDLIINNYVQGSMVLQNTKCFQQNSYQHKIKKCWSHLTVHKTWASWKYKAEKIFIFYVMIWKMESNFACHTCKWRTMTMRKTLCSWDTKDHTNQNKCKHSFNCKWKWKLACSWIKLVAYVKLFYVTA